ncbi:zinc finger protein VAR3, chloroplastic [Quillaja saponaria]|uniref:Zinc finger protein VAR3, chloroplastic n=1 Tax=Quillaja saponaria TaxID=32244 RepID=A0AAD7Q7T2_QUISA|nr:zinc finger protein VAR3, chloroplastic [Quillaja saponaria]
MAGHTRFFMLLATPFPLLHHRCPSLLRLSRHHKLLQPSISSLSHFHHLTCSPSNPFHPLPFPVKASQQLHNQVASSVRGDYFGDSGSTGFSLDSRVLHPWNEWLRFIDNLSSSGYFNDRPGIGSGHEFVAIGNLPKDFVREANACMAFARDRKNLLRLLSRKDIQVVVENGTPFLFKDADESVRRMKSFFVDSEATVLDTDGAHTVDLMRFILSYASNPSTSSEMNNLYNRELIEASVRNLFGELAKLSYSGGSNFSGTAQNQLPDRFGQTTKPLGQKIEMKRGDWICQRCSFMNFARNIKCLECEEARPKRQLTGGEWECPQCDFFNYGRNMTCLRCDCKRPGEVSLGTSNSMSGIEHGNGSNTNKSDIDSRLAANEEKAQRWFSKVSQLDSTSDISSAIADEDFPEIMPLRKGINRFVVSTRKTPLERRLANAQNRKNLANDGGPEVGELSKSADSTMNRSLDEILCQPSSLSQSGDKSITAGRNNDLVNPRSISSSSSPQYGSPKGSNSSYVPFVPLPADMFAKKSENSKVEENEMEALGSDVPSNTSNWTDSSSVSDKSDISGDNLQLFENPTTDTNSDDKEKEQAEKSERWFKRVAELHNVKDLTSAISDEDFPEIMPMRKGENRFVVSKKKDRSLTSPAYKRRLAMDQANNTNFVPFVPFPPDYFAKKDNQQPDGADSMDKKKTVEASSTSEAPEKSDDTRPGLQSMEYGQRMENQSVSMGSWSSRPSGDSSSNSNTGTVYEAPNSRNSGHVNSQTNNMETSTSKYFGNENENEKSSLKGSSSYPTDNQNIRESWTGKSLEGSAVKEPDPLDMSEEAKAERWFRRVAQIKDISELSQIPDEDFPSIMPMRKGVNRFVVSKRKTPLERRLTSQQYRKNLPIVSSDPVKKEDESS